ncbi:MAG TPA: cupin domain-containing protein [Thermomicrobiales bacterium]|nr:cupin domain-containing protein [Thermomicrobiales bacterium]
MTVQNQHNLTGATSILPTPRRYSLFGTILTILAERAGTAGHYDLIEGETPAGLQTPPHRHTRYSELLYVIDGELTIWTADRNVILHTGESFSIDTGVPHVVAATGQRTARGLVIASPSGFAALIEQAGIPESNGGFREPTPADLERFNQLATEFGDEILGQPGDLP